MQNRLKKGKKFTSDVIIPVKLITMTRENLYTILIKKNMSYHKV